MSERLDPMLAAQDERVAACDAIQGINRYWRC